MEGCSRSELLGAFEQGGVEVSTRGSLIPLGTCITLN